jgi:uncharacterized membrane protein YkgB
MVIIYFLFGYQKSFNYEVQGLVPFFCARIFDLLDASRLRNEGSTCLLGISEWLFGALLLAGFWNRKLGFLLSVAVHFGLNPERESEPRSTHLARRVAPASPHG